MNSFELNDCGQGKTRPGIKWIINIPQSPAPACDVRNEEGNTEYLTSPILGEQPTIFLLIFRNNL